MADDYEALTEKDDSADEPEDGLDLWGMLF